MLGEYRKAGLTEELVGRTAQSSPLGRVLAAGLINVKSSRVVMKESIEEVGGVVSHDLGRFLTTLGTIAAMAPLLGLFGTVVGMIEIFGSTAAVGANPVQLAHGQAGIACHVKRLRPDTPGRHALGQSQRIGQRFGRGLVFAAFQVVRLKNPKSWELV